MSHAWMRLRAAVHVLGQDGSPRERLAIAYSNYLLGLKPKELPAEIRNDFIRLLAWASETQQRGKKLPIGGLLKEAKDKEVTTMIDLVIDMYDAVTRYEPILGQGRPPSSIRRTPASNLRSAA